MFVCLNLLLGVLAAEAPEQRGMDEEVEQRRTDQSAEDHGGHGIEDFLARLAGGQHQRNQGDAGGERRHQHRGQPLLAGPLDHLRRELFAFVPHQVQVVGDQQNAVARGDARTAR